MQDHHFLNQFTVWHTGNDEFTNLEVDSHSMVAVLKSNLSISIAWGLRHNNDFVEKWANQFADSKAMSSFVDFFYNGVLVLKEIVVSVDGGRCYIPLPKQEYDDETDEKTKLYVPKEKNKFVELLNKFSSTHDNEEYFRQTGIELVNEPWHNQV